MGLARAGEDRNKKTPAGAVDIIEAESDEEARSPFVTGLDSKKACTIIYASDGRPALAGSNEDWTYHLNDVWFLPPEKGKFGRVYFGLNFNNGDHMPQGGMNDQGLFYDGASAESVIVPRDSSIVPFEGDLIQKAMEECSTVEEVLKLYERYHMSVGDGQLLIGDRFGNSAIMEATGSIIRKKGEYQIVTNFFQSRIKPENITDTRHRMAKEIFEKSENISVDLFRQILNATHWEEYSGSMTVTLYSYICDLKKGDIYIYHFHNFEDVVKINLRDELKKGERYLSILSLFPYETYAAKRHKAQWTVRFLYERALEKGVDGDEGAIALFKGIKRGDFDNYNLYVVEGHLNALAYELLGDNKTKQAIQTFEYAVLEYPESANAYDSLGEAYLKNGDTQKAIENYRKSLELNPENDNAREMLKKIDEE
jgi:tetratricopeptide (TPR) repeat protein